MSFVGVVSGWAEGLARMGVGRGGICYISAVYLMYFRSIYRQTSNIRRTLIANKNIDHSDVVEASPVGSAPTTSSFST